MHTQGTWLVSKCVSEDTGTPYWEVVAIQSGCSTLVGTFTTYAHNCVPTLRVTESDAECNAYMAAASPGLLAVCEQLVEWRGKYMSQLYHGNATAFLEDVVEEARKQISLAKRGYVSP